MVADLSRASSLLGSIKGSRWIQQHLKTRFSFNTKAPDAMETETKQEIQNDMNLKTFMFHMSEV